MYWHGRKASSTRSIVNATASLPFFLLPLFASAAVFDFRPVCVELPPLTDTYTQYADVKRKETATHILHRHH